MKKIDVTQKLVKHVSDLSRIYIDESDISQYQKNFQDILNYISVLDEVDTKEVAPLFNPITELTDFYKENIKSPYKFRKDDVEKSLEVKEVVKNAPQEKNNEFKIDSVIEE